MLPREPKLPASDPTMLKFAVMLLTTLVSVLKTPDKVLTRETRADTAPVTVDKIAESDPRTPNTILTTLVSKTVNEDTTSTTTETVAVTVPTRLSVMCNTVATNVVNVVRRVDKRPVKVSSNEATSETAAVRRDETTPTNCKVRLTVVDNKLVTTSREAVRPDTEDVKVPARPDTNETRPVNELVSSPKTAVADPSVPVKLVVIEEISLTAPRATFATEVRLVRLPVNEPATAVSSPKLLVTAPSNALESSKPVTVAVTVESVPVNGPSKALASSKPVTVPVSPLSVPVTVERTPVTCPKASPAAKTLVIWDKASPIWLRPSRPPNAGAAGKEVPLH